MNRTMKFLGQFMYKRNRFAMKLLSMILIAGLLAGSISTSTFAAGSVSGNDPAVVEETTDGNDAAGTVSGNDAAAELPADGITLSGGVAEALNPGNTEEASEPEETESVESSEAEEPEELEESGESDELAETDEAETAPAEVQALLNAAAALPDVSAITSANASEIGEQVNAVIDLWDAMDAELSAREDVEAAMNTVYAVFAAVLEAEEVGDAETYDVSNSMFGKTLTINERTYGNYAEETITAAISVGVGETVVDEGTLEFYNTRYGTYRVTSWIWFNVIVGDPTVLSVEKEINGANVKLTFKGLKDGSTTVTLDYGASLVSIGDSIWGSGNPGSVTGAGYYNNVQVGVGGPVKPSTKPEPNPATKVYFMCTSYPNSNPEGYNDTHSLWDGIKNLEGYYSLGEILPNDGADPRSPADTSPWMCVLTLNNEKCAKLYNQYKSYFGNKTHYLAYPDETVTLRYYYDKDGWYSWSADAPLIIWMSEDRPTSYMVNREYVKDGTTVKTVTDITKRNGNVGDQINGKTLADANTEWATYDGVTYTYKSCNPSPLTLTATAASNVITLRYEYSSPKYTVVYTDGVLGVTVFADQVYEDLKEGADTPAFEMKTQGTEEVEVELEDGQKVMVVQPKRDGYTFEGWAPTINTKVAGADAKNGVITYTATWTKQPDVTIDNLTITKTTNNENPTVGEELKYTIRVTNSSSEEVTVTVKDVLQDGLEFSRVSETDGGSYDKSTRTVTWSNVKVPAGGTDGTSYKELNLWVKANKTGKISNTATVELDNGSKPGNTVTVTAESPAPPTKEQAATALGNYKVTVVCTNGDRNHELAKKEYPLTAEDVTSIGTLTFENDKWTCVVSSSENRFIQKFENENGHVSHDKTNGSFDITLTYDYSAKAWTYEGSAEGTTIETACETPKAPTAQEVNRLVRGSNESAVDVYCKPKRHQVGHFDCYNVDNKTGEVIHTDRITIGEVIHENGRYTCTVTFLAQKYAEAYSGLKSKVHTLVKDETDREITFVWEANTQSWKLADDAEKPVVFYVECADPVVLAPKLKVEKTVDKTTVEADDIVTYTIKVTNIGNAAAENVKVTDELDGKLKYEEADNGGAYVSDTHTVTWTISKLEAGQSKTLMLKAKASVSGTITNTAYAKIDGEPDDKSVSGDAPAVTVKRYGIKITKSLAETGNPADGDFYQGDTVRYKVVVKNIGSEILYDTFITDTMDSGLRMTSVEDNEKCGYIGGQKTENGATVHTWNLNGEFAPGEEIALYYSAIIDDADSDLKNVAYAKGYKNPQNAGIMMLAAADDSVSDTTDMSVKDSVEDKDSAGVTVHGKQRPDVEYSWQGAPEGVTLPGKDSYRPGNEVNVDKTYTEGYEFTVRTGENAKTYVFSGWSSSDVTIGDEGTFTMPTTNVVITGSWTETEPEPTNPSEVTITVMYVDENRNELKPTEIITKKYDDEYDVSDKLDESILRGEDHYIKDSVYGDVTGKVQENKEITVIYTLDNVTDPSNDGNGDEKGDGIPDKYQAVVNYVAGANGTVAGTTSKVITLKDDNDAYVMNKNMVVGTEGVTVTAEENYRFDRWEPNPAEERTIAGGETYIYTAIFEAVRSEAPDPRPVNPTPTPDPTPVNPTPTPDPTPVNPAPTPDPTPADITPVAPVAVQPAAQEEDQDAEDTDNENPPAAQEEDSELDIADNETPLAVPEEQSEEDVIPAAEMDIEDEAAPLAAGSGGSWALVNFALMNLAVFETLMLLIGYFVNARKEEEDEEELKKKGIVRLISLPVAIIAIIVFCLTEDITLPTGFVDRWTILMAVLAVAQTVLVALSRKKEENR